ncbi:MAG: glutamate--tRNA ligase [Alphaproteobacteria bacterium]|nr:glutamate--tRNA ligase [Alphaproteobacteria bacterium]
MTVVTRFAPSPTGFLHIGGARTALFNWLFARHHKGVYRLRIEDTDRARSTDAAATAILDGLSWLGLDWDGEVVFQFARAQRHAEVAHDLLAQGKAYRCYCAPAELEEMRARAKAEGRPMRYDGRWRERDPKDAPSGVPPVIRMKAPLDGETAIVDRVQGKVTVANAQLDDMVLLRADGTPTYMHSVVVDDHDMGITHVIRGDDHLNNAFRQTQLYRACGWDVPEFAHIPLIHGADGAKLSKRHGALGVEAYRDMGYLPQALRNYLLRLGWSHGDDETISTAQAIEWFDLGHVGRGAARFDLVKLDSLNGHYIRESDDRDLAREVAARLTVKLGRDVTAAEIERLTRGMKGLKPRAKTLKELADNAEIYVHRLPVTDKAAAILSGDARARLGRLADRLGELTDWSESAIDAAARALVEAEAIKLGDLAQPLRAALTGTTVSPGVFEMAAALGRAECLARLTAVAASR